MSNDCPECGMRLIASGAAPTPTQRARHERGLTHYALRWLRQHPDQQVTSRRLARQLQDEGWTFDMLAKTSATSRASSVLYELLHLGHVQKLAPGLFVYRGEQR